MNVTLKPDFIYDDHTIFYHAGEIGSPLMVLMGSIHGDEHAGSGAIEMLNQSKINFLTCSATILGLRGNIRASRLNQRFICKDLNRLWSKDVIQDVRSKQLDDLEDEYAELHVLLSIIHSIIEQVQPSKIYYLDMHTTSSDGSIFCIVPEDTTSKKFAHNLSLPIVFDMLKNMDDTTLHYFNDKNLGIPTIALAFEGGHHKDPFSVYRCFAAIMRFFKFSCCFGTVDLTNNDYDHMLDNYYEKMPHETYVKYRYPIEDSRFWEMRPGFKHFSKIHKGEILARYNRQHITAQMDGYILMPLYQKQGSDGFFIVTEYP
jgi:succinylglutamate desuccinylase